ncbi:hypothetical protein H5410_041057 [Solanum commersonii]|uniref:Uncharacterized protein n=1 Tax=Solanum commersonii TaxID=4109 RepID=A0A9J5XSL0_SOLCO|nr:hypothetical protein H5410_041057 [Solanum commersonii]
MNLKTRGGQGNTKFEEEDLWRIANGRKRGSAGVQACECLACAYSSKEQTDRTDERKGTECIIRHACFQWRRFQDHDKHENLYIDEILTFMRDRHMRYPEYYDSTDRILDLNFYSNFKQRYDKISEEATTVGGISFTQLINEFEWNEDMINYVWGIRPYPGDMY